MALSDRRKAFCNEFIKSGNAYQAAIKAGYSERTAHGVSHKFLKDEETVEYLNELRIRLEGYNIADQAEILMFLTSVVRGECTEPMALAVGRGVQELKEAKVKATDRVKAAELLGKRYAMWTDKTETKHTGAVVISGEDELEDE